MNDQQKIKKLEGELAAKTREFDLMRKAMAKAVARLAAAAAGGNDLLADFIESRMTVVETETGFETRVMDKDGKFELISSRKGVIVPMQVEEFVAGLRTDPNFAPAFESEKKSGAGNGDAATARVLYNGPNPWAGSSSNLTEQMRLTKQNPALAERLMAEAQNS